MLSTFKGYTVTAPDGKTYDVNAPEGTSQEDLYEYVQQTHYPTEAVAGEVNKSAPLSGTREEVVATKALEEVPGAQQFLDAEFRKRKSFDEVRDMFNADERFKGVTLPEGMAKSWAENRAFGDTPEGRKYFETNSPIAPVNRSTGIADPEAPDSMLEEFGVSAKRSLANMANTVTGAVALGADIVGADDTAEKLLDTYLEKAAAIQQAYPTSAKNAVDIESFSDAGRWASSTLGELLPQVTSMGLAGTAGAFAGKQIAERGIKDFIEDQVANGVTREVAEQMAARIVQKKAATGATAAAAAGSEVQEVGSVYGDTYGEIGERKPWTSLLAGTAAAALDTVLPAVVIKKLGNAGDIAQTAVVNSLVKKVGKDAASAFLIEGGTEALQTIIEQLPAGKSIDWDQVVEAGLRGAFGGSVVGGAAGAYEGTKINNRATADKPTFEGDPIPVPVVGKGRKGKTYKAQLEASQDAVIARVDQLTNTWENKPEFEVYASFKDIKNIDQDSVGAYRNGKVVLNTENILKEAKTRGVTPDDIVSAVTFHEGLGHFGLEQLFGQELDAQFATILGNSPIYAARVQKWMDKNKDAYKNDPNRDIRALEEILAEGSEKGRMPASIVNVFKNKIKDLGRKMGLDLEYSTREVETILGMAHSAVVNGKGRNVRDNGYRMMFAGQNATGFNIGEQPSFIGPDGKVRWEFSDNNARFNDFVFRELEAGQSTELSNLLDHTELFRQYPMLEDMKIEKIKTEERDKGYAGWYNPETNTIGISDNLRTSKEKLSVILHEVQHAVQSIEGFQNGGNPSAAFDSMDTEHLRTTAKNFYNWKKDKYLEREAQLEAYDEFSDTALAKNLNKTWVDYYEDRGSREDYEAAYGAVLDAFGLTNEDIISNDELIDQWTELESIFTPQDTNKTPEETLRNLNRKQYTDGRALEALAHHVTSKDIPDKRSLIMVLKRNDIGGDLSFQAYESLFGEVEARATQDRMDWGDYRRSNTAPYQTQEQNTPESTWVVGDSNDSSLSGSRENRDGNDVLDFMTEIERERRAIPVQERQANEHQLELDRQNAANDRYMKMSQPDKVQFTPEEIEAMTPEELFDSENALNILDGMTEGYTPVVMSFDDLKQEAEDRGLSPSKVLRNNGIGAGEIVKRLYMYDIAMTKMNDRLSTLWEKIETGNFTVDDKNNYLRSVLKRDELAGRIFEDQGEIGRALAALKSIQYTRRRVKGMQETLVQFKKGSPYEALNDPEAFYKFALDIQNQIKEAKATAKDKGAEFIGNALNLPRALMSSMDLSAPLRQGLFLIHKGAWWRSFASMFRYAGSEKSYNDLMESITNRDTYSEMVNSKLALSNLGSKLSQREEDFMSSWAERIPVIGRLVRSSERAYVGFLNKLRADVFDELLSKLPEDASGKDKKDIAAFVNAATGRGNMPETLNRAAPLLNALFFSPRLMASRIKMGTVLIDPRTYVTMNKVARNEYIKSIFAVGSLAMLITSLAVMAGAESEEDPRSSDFAKIKIGNTRYDILGGQSQYVTLASRIVSGTYKTTDGEVKPYGTKFGQTTRLDAVEKFLSNKAAPIPSFVMDYLRGTDAVGKKFETDEAIIKRFIPMYMQDVQAQIEEQASIPKGAAMALPGLFGIGAQTYTSGSLDTEEPLEAPDDFQMANAVDGEYDNATVSEGVVTLDEKAKLEWGNRINFYYKEWMKDETSAPDWKTKTDDEKRDIIKEVRKDARKEAKLDMLDLLGIEEEEE